MSIKGLERGDSPNRGGIENFSKGATESTLAFGNNGGEAPWIEKDIQTEKKRNFHDIEE